MHPALYKYGEKIMKKYRHIEKKRGKVYTGWHFDIGKLGFGDGRQPREGRTLEMKPPGLYTKTLKPMMCAAGMHASPQIKNAACYVDKTVLDDIPPAIGHILCVNDRRVLYSGRHTQTLPQYLSKVEVWGETESHYGDKFCGRYRKVLKRICTADLIKELGKKRFLGSGEKTLEEAFERVWRQKRKKTQARKRRRAESRSAR